MKCIYMLSVLVLFGFIQCSSEKKDPLKHTEGKIVPGLFENPPADCKPWVLWFWINGNITREGIQADLEAMQRVGIGGVTIYHVGSHIFTPHIYKAGQVKFMSVIGNQQLDDPEVELSIMSLAGPFPIVLGDPRKISPENLARIKALSDWLTKMQDKHDFMMYRQDLAGLGEPQEGAWDGFQRINTDTRSGGIVGVFRQGAAENTRRIVVRYLSPEEIYQVRKGPGADINAILSGTDLAKLGFELVLDKDYDGALFEIESLKN